MKSKIEEFFSEYEKRFNQALQSGIINADEAAAAFSECFIECSPRGVLCAKNDEEFQKMIPKGYEHYKKIGTTSMKILSIEIGELDKLHYSAKVHWDSHYTKNNEDIAIKFDVIYLLRINNNSPEIFAYITGDEEQVLREKGLM